MVKRKNGLLDMRFTVNKPIKVQLHSFWYTHRHLFAVIMWAILFGLVGGIILWYSFHPPIVSPKGTGEVKVQQVLAEEPQPTPTINPNRRYLKYSYMPRYEEIMGQLKYLYKNWEDAADLQSRENGFNPTAINPTSGACGLSQALPCSKLPCELGNVACDLNWQYQYIAGRYGTVSEALKFQTANNWY
jgi:hypothetical protein